jgi:hypothetical protein
MNSRIEATTPAARPWAMPSVRVATKVNTSTRPSVFFTRNRYRISARSMSPTAETRIRAAKAALGR